MVSHAEHLCTTALCCFPGYAGSNTRCSTIMSMLAHINDIVVALSCSPSPTAPTDCISQSTAPPRLTLVRYISPRPHAV